MRHRGLVGAVNSWAEMAHTRRRFVAAARALLGRHLRAALNTWIGATAGLWQRRQLMSQALLRMQGREVWTAFSTWADEAAARRARMHGLRRLLSAVLHQSVRQGFNTWSAQRLGMSLAQHAGAAWLHGALYSAWRAWRAVAAEAAWLYDAPPHALRLMREVMERVARRLLRRVLQAWTRWAGHWGVRRRSAKLGARRAVWCACTRSSRLHTQSSHLHTQSQ